MTSNDPDGMPPFRVALYPGLTATFFLLALAGWAGNFSEVRLYGHIPPGKKPKLFQRYTRIACHCTVRGI
jgi:hypothetical protein